MERPPAGAQALNSGTALFACSPFRLRDRRVRPASSDGAQRTHPITTGTRLGASSRRGSHAARTDISPRAPRPCTASATCKEVAPGRGAARRQVGRFREPSAPAQRPPAVHRAFPHGTGRHPGRRPEPLAGRHDACGVTRLRASVRVGDAPSARPVPCDKVREESELASKIPPSPASRAARRRPAFRIHRPFPKPAPACGPRARRTARGGSSRAAGLPRRQRCGDGTTANRTRSVSEHHPLGRGAFGRGRGADRGVCSRRPRPPAHR